MYPATVIHLSFCEVGVTQILTLNETTVITCSFSCDVKMCSSFTRLKP